jgi:capsular exopolysaccharide synthesis family protein
MAKRVEVGGAKENKTVLLTRESSFSVQEAFKSLRTNISFSIPGNKCKCIGIVSSNRGDGKSTIALNLAISLGQINKRVLLIDCDMRLPTVARNLGVVAKPGLSDYLVGDETAARIPIRTIDEKGIDVITSGAIPPDSTILLESEQMTALVERLKEEYDYIIFDLPPITIVSDALILSKHVDGYLIVVRHNTSEYSKINETIRYMQLADCKILGFVYNGKGEEKKYYKYRKNSYYKYYYKNSYYK